MRKVCVSIVILSLLACAAAGFAAGRSESGEKTTITFSTNWVGSDTKAAAFGPYLEAFNSKYPAYKLVVQATPGTGSAESLAKYYTMASAGTLPDVFNFWPGMGAMAPLVSGNHLADLKSYIEKDPVFSKQLNAAWMYEGNTQFEKNGPNYGLPAEFYFCFLYVNKKLFQDAGAPLPATWADVKTAIPLLRAKGITPLGWAGSDGDLNTNLWAALLDRLSPDDQVFAHMKAGSNLDEVSGFRRAYEAFGELAKLNAFPDGAAAMTQPDPVIAGYNQGKVAMFEGGTWYIGQITAEASRDTVVMPLWTFSDAQPTDPTSLIGGVSMSYMVNRKSWENPKKQAALDAFLHYVESPDLYTKWTQSGVPPLLPVTFPADANPLLVKAMELQKKTSTLSFWFTFDVPKMLTVVASGMQGIVNGSATVDQAYKDLVQAARTEQ
jgi:raffinose/stachyose/melibiose transport system substrate-binding protein